MLEKQLWMRSEKKELPEDACGLSSANHVAVKEQVKQSFRREVAGFQSLLIFFLSPRFPSYAEAGL